MVIHENIWSVTTGKHINMIAGDNSRVNKTTFEKLFKEMGGLPHALGNRPS